MTEHIKPCPFCGNRHMQVSQPDRDLENYFVVCLRCEAVGPYGGSAKQAIYSWNQRDGGADE